MKYLLVLLLGFILGALAYRQVSINPTPEPAPAASAPAGEPETPGPAPSQATQRTPVPPVPPEPVATPPVDVLAGMGGLLVPVQGKTPKDLGHFTDAARGRLHDAMNHGPAVPGTGRGMASGRASPASAAA